MWPALPHPLGKGSIGVPVHQLCPLQYHAASSWDCWASCQCYSIQVPQKLAHSLNSILPYGNVQHRGQGATHSCSLIQSEEAVPAEAVHAASTAQPVDREDGTATASTSSSEATAAPDTTVTHRHAHEAHQHGHAVALHAMPLSRVARMQAAESTCILAVRLCCT